MKCRGKHDTALKISRSITFSPLHNMLYRGKQISFGTVWHCHFSSPTHPLAEFIFSAQTTLEPFPAHSWAETWNILLNKLPDILLNILLGSSYSKRDLFTFIIRIPRNFSKKLKCFPFFILLLKGVEVISRYVVKGDENQIRSVQSRPLSSEFAFSPLQRACWSKHSRDKKL